MIFVVFFCTAHWALVYTRGLRLISISFFFVYLLSLLTHIFPCMFVTTLVLILVIVCDLVLLKVNVNWKTPKTNSFKMKFCWDKVILTYMGTCIGHIQQGCQNHFVSAQCQNHFVLRQSSSDIPAVCSLCMYPCNIYSFHIFFFTVNWFLLEKSNVGDPSHSVFRVSYCMCSPVQPLMGLCCI